jgi:hypothetical protein
MNTIATISQLILLILLAFLSLFTGQYTREIRGGSFDIDMEYAIIDDRIIIIDGNNIVHSILSTYPDKLIFSDAVILACRKLSNAFPSSKIHFVMKNYNDGRKAEKMKINGKLIPRYIDEVADISRMFTNITFHIAYKENADTTHLQKERDDFLVLYLANIYAPSWIISNDKYRDYKQFPQIKSFKFYSVENGKILNDGEEINPLYDKISKPISVIPYRFDNARYSKLKYEDNTPILTLPMPVKT